MGEKKWKERKRRKKYQAETKEQEINDGVEENIEIDEDQMPKWYEQFKNDKYVYEKLSENELVSLRIEAQHILDEETKTINSKQSRVKQGSNAAWINTVLKKGTFKDKLAANVVTIQNSPVHALSNLTTLVTAVNPAKKKECITVMETLAELFIEDLLRPERKLRPFDKQSLTILNEISGGCAKGRRLRLEKWLFEDKLKDLYKQFVDAINKVAMDTVETNRIKAVSIMYKLLSSHPEQEQLILQNLVNKLGDPVQKIVSKVMYCLTQLLRVHPNMKQIVMNEVEKLVFRPNLKPRTQYYCICFLSQFIFESNDMEIARNIITLYFSFFKALIKKGEIDSRLMGALLMGVKRAYPFAKLAPDILSAHIDTLYKLVHLTPFNIALHSLALLQEISDDANDRFYCALYKKLLDSKLNTSCHHAMFINLMFKSLSKDSNIIRVKAFIKRLLQVCLYSSVPLVCGILYMVSQLIARRKLSLFADSVKPQTDAFASFKFDENDADEKYVDVDKEEVEIKEENIKEEQEEEEEEKKPLRGWLHSELTRRTNSAWTTLYDSLARNPSYSNADKTAYIELLYLEKHFHPTVALFSQKILNQEVITYSGDPLVDFTVAKFLERFVFKNPKVKNNEDKGPDPQLAQRKYYRPSGVRALQVTSSNYLASDIKDIPVDELFLYKYLSDKNKGKQDSNDYDDDNASVTSEEFVDMIDKLYGRKVKEDIDFMDEIEHNLKKKSKEKKGNKEDDDESDEEEEAEDDEEEEEDEDEDLLMSNEGDDDNEVIEFDDEKEFEGDLDFDEIFNKISKKSKTKSVIDNDKGKNRKKKSDNFENLFAPAEEFAEILEEAGSSKHKLGMADSLATNDNAATRQLNWETKRDRWVRDVDKNKRKWNGKSKKNFKKRKL